MFVRLGCVGEFPLRNLATLDSLVHPHLGVAQTLRVPGRFEFLPTARREYRTPLSGRVEVLVSQYQSVEPGTPLYRVDAAAWRDLHEQITANQARVDSMGPLREAHRRHEQSLADKVLLWQERLKQLEDLLDVQLLDRSGRNVRLTAAGDVYLHYARRALRIFPLYYGVLAVALVLSIVAPSFSAWGTENPAWMWAYLTNFVTGIQGGGSFGVLDHFWSLAVEEHYYLVWPAIVFFLNRRSLMVVAGCALIIALLLRISVTDMENGMRLSGYMFTPMRMDSLAAGSLIALAARGPGGVVKLAKPAAIIGSIAFIAFAAIVIVRDTPSYHDPILGTIGLSLLWASFGSMLILSLTWKPLSALMSTAFLRWFGKYSYGLYVWHPIVIIPLMHSDWSRAVRGDSVFFGSLMMAFALALSIGVALLSWNIWEKQFLKLKVKFA